LIIAANIVVNSSALPLLLLSCQRFCCPAIIFWFPARQGDKTLRQGSLPYPLDGKIFAGKLPLLAGRENSRLGTGFFSPEAENMSREPTHTHRT